MEGLTALWKLGDLWKPKHAFADSSQVPWKSERQLSHSYPQRLRPIACHEFRCHGFARHEFGWNCGSSAAVAEVGLRLVVAVALLVDKGIKAGFGSRVWVEWSFDAPGCGLLD